MHVSRWAAVALLLVVSCKAADEKQPASSASSPALPRTLTAEDLQPTFQLIGAEGALPAGVEISFRPAVVFDEAGISGADINLVPNVAGSLTKVTPNRLHFVPDVSFDLSTDYEVTLDNVVTKDGVLSGDWSWKFATPPFQLALVQALPLDKGTHEVYVDLVFSGNVDAATARRFVSATVDGTAANLTMKRGSRPQILRARVSTRTLQAGSKVAVSLRKGLPQAGAQHRAPATTQSFTVVSAGFVQIQGAFLREGSDGHHFEFVCNDTGSGGRRHVWDSQTGRSWYVSRRCEPSPVQAKEMIHLDPPVDFTVAPARAGFAIFGRFGRGPVKVTLDKGLVTKDGGVLGTEFVQDFVIPPRPPSVSIVSGGRYLPRSAWKSLAVKHVNVEQAELTVRQVRPENLVYWMSDDTDEKATARNSTQLLQTTLALRGKPDEQTTTWVDVSDLLPATTRGVLELKITGSGAAESKRSRILLTDMAVIAKRSIPDPKKAWAEDVRVWVVGIDDAQPVRGAEASLVRRNGHSVAHCRTNTDGWCRLKVDKPDNDPDAPFAVVVKNRSTRDVTYVKWADLKIEPAEQLIAGEPYLSDRPYRATFYTDRGVYRPGDTAHAVAVLRDRDGDAPKAELPVVVKVTDPRGRLAKRLTLKANKAGMVALDLPFNAFADTGKWTLDLEVAEEPVVATAIQVEEFVPERMKVTAAATRESSGFDEQVAVDVSARYLFGGTAEGSEVEMTCELAPRDFRPKVNAGYTYGVWHGQRVQWRWVNNTYQEDRIDNVSLAKPVNLGAPKGVLDANGQTSLKCPAPSKAGSFKGPGLLIAKASVFEAGSGRSTLGMTTVPVHPEAYYLGLSSKARRAQAGTPLSVEGIVVDWNGEPLAPGKVPTVHAELVRLEPNWNDYYYYDGGRGYGYALQPVAEWSGSVKVGRDGKFKIEATPRQKAAVYLVRVHSGKARADLEILGSYDGWSWNLKKKKVDLTPKPGRPAALVVSGPSKMRVGDTTTVRFKAPYSGRVLLSAETNRVLTSEWKTVRAGEVSWSFTLGEFAPNVYISALLVKDPHLESAKAYRPDRAFGVTSIAVEPTAWRQNLTLTAPKEIRSNSDFEVTVDVGPTKGPTYATIAVVDEGILQLTRFQSPDPLASLFARRALGIETYETIGWTMLVPPAGATKAHGGDAGDESAAGRVQPVKPVALWSGVVDVPASGRITVPFHVPLYRGKLRVMAVTSGKKRIGAASASIAVVDPIVVQTTLPRFLTYGDTFQVPVFLTNMSGKPLNIEIALTADNLAVPGVDSVDKEPDPIQFIGQPKGSIQLPSGKNGTVVFHAKANKMIGAAKLRVVARGGGHESHDELDVPFLPSGPRDREVKKLLVKGKSVDLTGTVKGWLPGSERTTFWVTANPYGEAFTNLQPLIRYPYG